MQATQTPATNGRVMYWGTGRRKASVARVRLVPGNGQLVVNGKAGDLYFQFNASYLAAAKAPLETLGLENVGKYDTGLRGCPANVSNICSLTSCFKRILDYDGLCRFCRRHVFARFIKVQAMSSRS